MTTNIIEKLESSFNSSQRKIVFPEATEPKILAAAKKAFDKKIMQPVLVGDITEIMSVAEKEQIDITGMELIPVDNEERNSNLANEFYKVSQTYSVKKLNRLMKNPLYLAAMLLQNKTVDGLVAGLTYTTAEVILACQFIVGLAEGTSIASSFFIMDIPNYEGPEGNLIILADGGVCENPDAEELASIAITTAYSAKNILKWEPRVAMLSYSTKGSASSEDTKFILSTLELAKEKAPDLKIDGEFQLDAAVRPDVAKKKVKDCSEVAGIANILILPNLTTGNILYKSIQTFAGAKAYGPLLQGFNAPISDLSRGSSVEDIYGVIVLTASQINF